MQSKKILFLSNHFITLYSFRKELIQRLVNEGHEVYISTPADTKNKYFYDMGCNVIDTPVDRRGTNPIKDIQLLLYYQALIKKNTPDIVLTFTIKPNIYGGLACRATKTPHIANVTGLGTSIENGGFLQKITLILYANGLRKASCVFFQNEANKQFFIDKHIVSGNIRLVPGSGVNLKEHRFEEYPDNDELIKFLFIGRIMRNKGIDELLEAAQKIKHIYPNTQFHLIGGCEEDYMTRLNNLEHQGIIRYHGHQNNVHSFIKSAHTVIHPSYHEGMSNALLEAASTGRPVLASNIPGCKEIFDEGVTGFGFEARSTESLINAAERFINLPYEEKKKMGAAGRKKMENEFNRNIVINAYLDEMQNNMGA